MQVSRRQFFKICGAGLSGSSIALMGYSPTSALAEVRSYKLARATENPQHVSLLLGELRGPDLHHG
jgi:anaerobic selenocysteine-containing dehydrogenase